MKFPLMEGGRRLIGGMAWNISDRKRMEKLLQSSEERFKHILSSSPAVLFILSIVDDHILGIKWITENLRDMLGYSTTDALVPGWWRQNTHPDDRAGMTSLYQAGLFDRGHMIHEFRFRHKDGQYRWTRGEVRLIRDPTGQTVEAVGAWTDITSQKALEAHDFNNLLTVINGYSDILLLQLSKNDPSRKLIAEIHKAGERSAGLTRQLLAFSRQQLLAPRVLDLNEVVHDTEKMLRRLIGEDVRLTTTFEPKPWAVRADPGQIEQVLLNLAVNARDAMPKGGRLTIETRNIKLDESYALTHKDARTGPHVALSVADTGSGIPPEVMAKIFEPFFTTKEPGKGTGLGLATVYGIVKQSGGHIGVYSEVGIGTTFKVYLPRVEEAVEDVKPPSRTQAPPRGTETILLAEDEAGVRNLTSYLLRECGYTVLEAVDGVDAIRVAAVHDGAIDLLITDVVMPSAGGRVASEELSRQYPGLRVLFVSGYTDDAVIRHGVLREGVNFLQKPFTPLAMAVKVREVLDAPVTI